MRQDWYVEAAYYVAEDVRQAQRLGLLPALLPGLAGQTQALQRSRARRFVPQIVQGLVNSGMIPHETVNVSSERRRSTAVAGAALRALLWQRRCAMFDGPQGRDYRGAHGA